MKGPKLLTRLNAALYTIRYGFSGKERKYLPFAWPVWRQGVPEWHLINLQSYIDEGFNLNSLVYSAIMCKVKAMIPAPLRAYSGDPDYPTPLERSHSLAKLVTRPNEHQSWAEFQSLNVVYLNLDGNVFIWKNRQDREMYSLRPDRVYIVPRKSESIATLQGFIYVPEGKSWREGWPIIPEDMIHIKLPNPGDTLEGMGYGLSPLSPAAQVTDIDNLVTKFLDTFFTQGGQLTGLLKYKTPLKESHVDIIRERWREKYGGSGNWGIGIIDRDAEYQRVGLSFEEMGFKEIDARNETRILAPFGVPPILIGSRVGLDRSTYSNYGEARKAFWEDTLLPEMHLFETEFRHHLKAREAFVQFDTSRVPALQKDKASLASAAFSLFQMGVPANQALKEVGLYLGPIPDGDKPFAGREPPASNRQGPRADAEDDSWGMR